MDGGDEGDTFSFSVAPATTTATTATPATGAARRRGGAAAGGGAGRGAGKTRAAGGRGRGAGATTGRGRGRGAKSAAAAAADEAPPIAASSVSGADGEHGSGGEDGADEGDAGDGGDDATAVAPVVAAATRERNGTWGRPEQVQQAKEAVVADVFQDLVDDLLREIVFEMHRHVHTLSKAKMGLMCFSCEDQYPSGIVDKNGYDIFGQAVSGKIVTGEVRFDCLNCGRTVVASRYAPHLEKCMGIGRIARNSSRIASRRMKALDEDVYVPNPSSAYTASPSFEDDDDEDDDDATYGEHGKHRAMLKEEVQSFIGEESHVAASPSDEHTSSNTRGGHNSASSTTKQHPTKRGAAALGAGASAAAGQSAVKGAKGGARRQPPKKKGRASEPAEADSALISFGDDDSFGGELGDVDVEEMDAGVLRNGDGRLYDMRGAEDVEVDNGASSDDHHHEKTTAKRKGKLAGRGRGHGGAK